MQTHSQEIHSLRTAVPSSAFFRCGAAAAAASVLGIIVAQLLIGVPYRGPEISDAIRTYADPAFQAQSLTILLQVMAMFVAMIVLLVKVFPCAPGMTIMAAALLLLWQVFELVPRSIDYFVLAREYAVIYTAGLPDAILMENEFRRFFAWERGLRTMRQAVWSAALLLTGLGAWRVSGLGRLVGSLFVLNGLRVAALLAATLSGVALPFGRWIFIVVNVASFALLAHWLWIAPSLEQHTQRI